MSVTKHLPAFAKISKLHLLKLQRLTKSFYCIARSEFFPLRV